MRTREEQVAEIENFCGTLAISGDTPNSHAIREWLKEAEERGFKRYQSKKTDHTAIDGSPSIKQWQHDQEEYFDPTIIEIVEEYAAWRDKQEAECAADTRRLEWLLSRTHYGIPGFDPKVSGRSPSERKEALIRAIDAAMEGEK